MCLRESDRSNSQASIQTKTTGSPQLMTYTGSTSDCDAPGRENKKISTSRDRTLKEKYILVQYIEKNGDGFNWIYSKKLSVWENASSFLSDVGGCTRTSEPDIFIVS